MWALGLVLIWDELAADAELVGYAASVITRDTST